MGERATAVLLVHGIGSQRVGDTAAKLTDGLRRAYPNVEADIDDGSGEIRIDGRTLRVYEVWWADLLDGDDVRGSFSVWSLHELAWLPWLNWRAGVIPRRRLTAVLWTGLFAPLVFFVQLAYLVSAVSPHVRRVFDERVADVLNYVDSADRDLPDTSALVDVSERIEARVAARLENAVADGAEDIVVVAHSLGSVIAYRTLMRGLAERPDERWARVTTFITIGSPINTFSLVWPRLVAPVGDAPVHAIHWDNIHDRFDLIASGMRHVRPFSEPVHEHTLFGRSGFAFAHTSYERHPEFLTVLSERLTGAPAHIPVRLRERILLLVRSVAECLGVVSGAVVALAIGSAVAVVVGAVVACVVAVFLVAATVFENYAVWTESGWTFGGTVRGLVAVIMVMVFVAVPLIFGRVRARRRHYAHVHNVRPNVTGVGEDVPEPATGLTVAGAVSGAAAAIGFTLALWLAGGVPGAWDADVGVIARVALGLGYAVFGAFGALMGMEVVHGAHWCWQTWRQWLTATR